MSYVEAVASHAAASGLFDRVNMHEVASAPGRGLSCEVWTERMATVPAVSGLAVVSVRVEVTVRITLHADREPRDTIEPELDAAAATLFGAYAGDFELGGEVMHVDLMGAYGPGLTCASGYLLVDQTRYRTRTISVPLIIDDVHAEVP